MLNFARLADRWLPFAGIAWVLKVLLRDVTPLPELVAHACYLLSNLVAVEPKLQERAREQRAFEIISRYLQVRSPARSVSV